MMHEMKRPYTRSSKYETMRNVSRSVYAIGLAGSLSVLLFLNIADFHAQLEAQRHISQMQDLCREEGDEKRLATLKQARSYNETLAGGHPNRNILPYEKQLFYKEDPMISFIEIPRISIKLPIYHGVDENALMAGVGHWRESSLPVGGKDAHCVLMGHSGMANTRMFDDVGKLVGGDKIIIWTLNDPYCYQVESSETVLPERAVETFAIEPGSDMLTLVTCRPIGVNTHRLLIHAKRCEYHPNSIGSVGIDAYVNDRNIPLIIAATLLLSIVIASGIHAAQKGGKPSTRKEKGDGAESISSPPWPNASEAHAAGGNSPHHLRHRRNRFSRRDGPNRPRRGHAEHRPIHRHMRILG